jgi:hypothetical protein
LLRAAAAEGEVAEGVAAGFDGFKGTLAVVTPSSTLLEIEPNDDPTQAQAIGSLAASQTLTVLGSTTDSGADPFDGFQLEAPDAITVTATLDHDPANDFDFFVYDPVSQTIVHSFSTTAVPEVGTFTIQDTFQVVVASFTGEGEYTLTLDAWLLTPRSDRRPPPPRSSARSTRTSRSSYRVRGRPIWSRSPTTRCSSCTLRRELTRKARRCCATRR